MPIDSNREPVEEASQGYSNTLFASAAISNLAEGISQFAARWAEIGALFQQTLRPFAEMVQHLYKEVGKIERLEAAGWLPHFTMPMHLIGEEPQDGSGLSAQVQEFYRSNWPEIESRFMTSVNSLDIDQEAKDTFKEALQSHGNGFYRVSPRLLFPEIERLARSKIYSGQMGGITSLPDLQKTLAELPVGEFLSFDHAVQLFERLKSHLYSNVKTEERLGLFANDPIPNRHAAIHGLVSYNTYQSSLNALILSHFLFHMIEILSRYDESEA